MATETAHLRLLMLAGASSVHTIRWANALVEAGVEVHLVSQHDPVDPLNKDVHFHRFPHTGGLGYVTNGPKLKKLINTIHPDVVNAHYATGYGTLGRWVGATPLVLNVWGSDVYDFPASGPAHRKLLRGNLERADLVVSTSHAMAEQTRTLVPSLGTIEVLPFGVDTDLFAPSSPARDPGPLVVGTVKSFLPKYGVDLLIDAFALLGDTSGAPPLLRLVGSGEQEEALREQVKALGLSDRVTFVPRVPHDKVPDELRKLDIYVALSRLDSESFGVAVIEASACGLPVVVSDVGGLPEVVQHGVTGIVVPRNNAAAAAEALRELIAKPELRQRMGQAGRAHVQAKYEWHACVQRMVQLLRATAQGHYTRS